MNDRKKILLILSLLLLTSLACATVTDLFRSQPPQRAAEPDFPANGLTTAVIEPTESPANGGTPTSPEEQTPEAAGGSTTPEGDGESKPAPSPEGRISATGDAAELEVTELNWFQDEDGTITFLGKLKNNGSTDLVFVELAFILRDENGGAVASDYTYAALDILPAGESSPFKMFFFEPPYDPWVSYEIMIEGDVNNFFEYYSDFEVVSSQLEEGSFGYDLTGELKNTGDQKASFVMVNAVVYNRDDEIISVDFTFAEKDVLKSGETSPFTLSVWSTLNDQEPDHFELYLQGNPSE